MELAQFARLMAEHAAADGIESENVVLLDGAHVIEDDHPVRREFHARYHLFAKRQGNLPSTNGKSLRPRPRERREGRHVARTTSSSDGGDSDPPRTTARWRQIDDGWALARHSDLDSALDDAIARDSRALVPRDLLRAYRSVREETDDAMAECDLVRVGELLPVLEVLRDQVVEHLEAAA